MNNKQYEKPDFADSENNPIPRQILPPCFGKSHRHGPVVRDVDEVRWYARFFQEFNTRRFKGAVSLLAVALTARRNHVQPVQFTPQGARDDMVYGEGRRR